MKGKIKSKYWFGFRLSALIFYLCQLLPNIIWWLFTPENDLLSKNSSPYPAVNAFEQIFGILMMLTLVFVVRRDKTTNHLAFFIGAVLFMLGYYVSWIMYFSGATDPYLFLFGFALMPILAFGMFGAYQKNYFVFIPLVIFAVFHISITCGTFL